MTTGLFADTFPSTSSPSRLQGATMSWASWNGRRIDYALLFPTIAVLQGCNTVLVTTMLLSC